MTEPARIFISLRSKLNGSADPPKKEGIKRKLTASPANPGLVSLVFVHGYFKVLWFNHLGIQVEGGEKRSSRDLPSSETLRVRARCARRLGWVVVSVLCGTATVLAGVWRSPPSSGDGEQSEHLGGWFLQVSVAAMSVQPQSFAFALEIPEAEVSGLGCLACGVVVRRDGGASAFQTSRARRVVHVRSQDVGLQARTPGMQIKKAHIYLLLYLWRYDDKISQAPTGFYFRGIRLSLTDQSQVVVVRHLHYLFRADKSATCIIISSYGLLYYAQATTDQSPTKNLQEFILCGHLQDIEKRTGPVIVIVVFELYCGDQLRAALNVVSQHDTMIESTRIIIAARSSNI
ncbi:hypothetical protein BDB00DRAFT_878335 [Zychaea mexicana]|uniref:uncharacterized protein n=1 Tax=Zychaea mexicana TaxID=64656 RepID=UPI0022FDC462|nr:uncharacterized protein BDB00DRAFT_878335 [Zychaea mexicana]KAI9484918.1 hypothetical protein BDB00DRAFT_878335 [Zychaea mexicana]